MATKLNNGGMDKAMTVSDILKTKGRVLDSGFMDEFDREAEKAASAIGRMNGLRPQKIGKRKAGFGKSVYHPNADRYNLSLVG